LRPLLTGVLIGTAAAWLESGPLARSSRALPLWAALLTRTVAYAIVVAAVMVLMITLVSWVGFGAGPMTVLRAPEFQALLSAGTLAAFFTLLLAASFLINFGLQLRRVLGPATLRALFLGTYRRPRREERAFAFLDLTDSTAWAERLGPLKFTDFKNDFFADVAEPVLATGGRIVQYVGDEVMVSWTMKQAEETGAPVEFFFLVESRIAANAERYRKRYGEVPSFKAGLHGGEVVTAEVGDLKRDIVHSGDVVNTAARIEGECRPRGRRLIASASLVARMPALEAETEELGEVSLRGKAEPVGLVALSARG
ncbi:adenylate/guanylate cyclase domain-containing protein, partial [Rubrivirga sp.]|uniref:adenylate/guanylate cyclase domain-containing protein n=1 Tax=Rubrivirga sp. TaxID=1885344 RepID=UPI003C77EEBB